MITLKKFSNSWKLIPLITTLSLLSACSRTLEVKTVPTESTIVHPEFPRPIVLEEVTFKVVTPETLNEIIRSWRQEQGSDYAFIAISVKDYEAILINLEEVRRYIRQQREIILYYRNAVKN